MTTEVKPINEGTEEQVTDPLIPKTPKPRGRLVVVEPLVFFVMMCSKGSGPLTQEYLLDHYSKYDPILSNSSYFQNISRNVCDVNKSDPVYIARQHVQQQTSEWVQIQSLVTSSATLLVLPIFGAYSDFIGRKGVLFVGSLGMTIRLLVFTLVVFLKLHPWVMFLGSAAAGLTGSYNTIGSTTTAYIADTTRQEQRAFRFVILTACHGIGEGIAQIGIGYWKEAMGALPSFIFLTSVMVLTTLYVVFFIPETVTEKKKGKVSEYLLNMLKVYTAKVEGGPHRGILGLILLSVFCYVLPGSSRISLLNLYTMNEPLCWGAVMFGYFVTAHYFSSNIGSIVGVVVFKKCGFSERGIGMISIITDIAAFLTLAFSTKTLTVFLACIPCLVHALIMPMARALVSKECKPDQQGSAFAGMYWINVLCILIGGVFLNEIYQKTLFLMKGFVFLVSAGFSFLSLLAFISASVLMNYRDSRVDHHTQIHVRQPTQ